MSSSLSGKDQKAMRNWSGSGTGCQACSTTSKAMWAATTREHSSESDNTLPSRKFYNLKYHIIIRLLFKDRWIRNLVLPLSTKCALDPKKTERRRGTDEKW